MTGVTSEEVEEAADREEPATEEVDEERELPSRELLPVLPELELRMAEAPPPPL